MKPALSVAANINIRPGYEFGFVKSIKVNVRPTSPLVISSHNSWFAIVFLLGIFSASAGATSIVVFVGSKQIIIAADGVVTAKSSGHATPLPFCKIQKSGEVYYAISGDYGVPGTNLDVWEMAGKAAERTKTFPEVYESARSLVMPQLKAIVDRNKLGDPETYSRWLNGDPVIEMAFAKFETSGPIAVGVTFYIDGSGNPVDPPTHNVMRPGSENAAAIARLGQHNTIETALKSMEWARRFRADSVDGLRYLIELEIDRATVEKRFDVGLPIAIMRITKTGSDFIDGFAGNCPNAPNGQKAEHAGSPFDKPPENTIGTTMSMWTAIILVVLAGILAIARIKAKRQQRG